MSPKESDLSPLALWGGIECTVNRVGDQYLDQIVLSRHSIRPKDLENIAALGIRTLRYPVLWEWTAPEKHDLLDWAWADERLPLLQRLGIRPIVGLVHHGSGPRYTNLLDPSFAQGLAAFASKLIGRFPWLDAFTPINEPLTTARFSGLYGHWFPHGCEPSAFLRALLNQCRAVVLAMEAIRRIRPDAQLVQTEDLGKTYSTPALQYQAEFENERRWLTYDLLSGTVNRQHALASYFQHVGVPEQEWLWFCDHPCPPDILGINHYLTSERFLDENCEPYPPNCHGGNGREAYADVEAVRVCAALAGPEGLLRETWQRYHRALAVTEAHLGCTREQQMRWLAEVWQAANTVRREGADVRAVTVWAMLGSYDWDSLVTRLAGNYESGVFDVRGPEPRRTALARLTEQLAAGIEPDHAVLDFSGWWRQPQRILYGNQRPMRAEAPTDTRTSHDQRLLLITGATGTLGRAFARICTARGLPHRLLGRKQMDIACPESVEMALAKYNPWAVINAAGHARIDDAECEPSACFRANTLGPIVLAQACARRAVPLLTFSSDLVFDGFARLPYCESAIPRPLCVYGHTKARAETEVLARHPATLVVRTSSFFGPWDDSNFVASALRTLEAGIPFLAADDLVVSPTYVPELVHVSLDLLIDGERGIWHLANQGELTWVEFACNAARVAGLEECVIEGRPAAYFGWHAPRPAYGVLGSERGFLLSPLEHAISRYFAERETAQVGEIQVGSSRKPQTRDFDVQNEFILENGQQDPL